jgi:SAM-dependent methyltransferase
VDSDRPAPDGTGVPPYATAPVIPTLTAAGVALAGLIGLELARLPGYERAGAFGAVVLTAGVVAAAGAWAVAWRRGRRASATSPLLLPHSVGCREGAGGELTSPLPRPSGREGSGPIPGALRLRPVDLIGLLACVVAAVGVGMLELEPVRAALPTFVAAGLVVAALLYAPFGRLELVLVAAAPVACALLWTAGLLGLAGVPLSPPVLVGLLSAGALAVDLSLFSLEGALSAWRRPDGEAALGIDPAVPGAVAMGALYVAVALFGARETAVAGMLGEVAALAAVGWIAPLHRVLLPTGGARVAPSIRRLFRAVRAPGSPHRAGPSTAGASAGPDRAGTPAVLASTTTGPSTPPATSTPASTRPSSFRDVLDLYAYRGPYIESYLTWKLRIDPIYRGVAPLVPARGRVLDLGCGYGLMSHILAGASLEREVIGVDFDERKIDVARCAARARSNVRFEVGDVFAWPYPPADAVVMVDMLHYWSEARQLELIARVCRCLRPGGTAVFRDGCATDSGGHLATTWGERFSTRFGFNRRGQGLQFGTRQFYVDAFEAQGLRLVAEPAGLGLGSNRVLVFQRPGVPD